MDCLLPRFLLYSFLLWACSVGAEPLNSGDRHEIEQRQKLLIENNQQQLDSLRRQSSPSLEEPSPVETTAHQPCFTIRNISWSGATLLSESQQAALSAPYQDQCLGLERINLFLRDINQWYMKEGYITSRAFLPEQDLANGYLHIAVMEGRIERIDINGQPDPVVKVLFPGLIGEQLNLRDIEQGVDQLQRLRSFNFQIDIQPGTRPGFSIINLKGHRQFPVQGSIGYDNSGQENTGDQQGNINLTLDSLFGLAERWSVSGARSLEGVSGHDSSSLQADLDLAYGYWNFDYGYSYSDYCNDLLTRGFVYRSEGNSQSHKMTVSRVIHRNGTAKSSLQWAVNHRRSHNYISEQLLLTSSYNFSSTSLNLNHGFRWGPGFVTFNPGLTLGTDWFGAKEDDEGEPNGLQAQFQKWTLFSSYGGRWNEQLGWLSSLYAQWTPDQLYSVEKVSLGGESSIRGFKEQSVSGDHGGYWRNELNWYSSSLPVIGVLKWWSAFDAGRVQLDDGLHGKADLIGSAFGVEQQSGRLLSSIGVGFPLKSPAWMDADHYAVYYRFGLTL